MAKLYLLRHFKSQWNKDDRFAGWVDNPLSDEGREQAKEVGKLFQNPNVIIDVAYCNALVRCKESILRIYEQIPSTYPIFMDIDGGNMQEWGKIAGGPKDYVPVYVSEKLNERSYGDMQGLNKAEMKEKFGHDLVHQWRRVYKSAPPGGESMEDTYKRVMPFYHQHIEKDLKDGKNVLVVASHNSLRALAKYLENISDDDVANLELPFGALVTYDYKDGNFEKLQ